MKQFVIEEVITFLWRLLCCRHALCTLTGTQETEEIQPETKQGTMKPTKVKQKPKNNYKVKETENTNNKQYKQKNRLQTKASGGKWDW